MLSADSYELTSIKLWPNGYFTPVGLYSENGAKSLELRDIVSNIIINESLTSSTLDITLDILDGNNILEDLRIEGDEYITIQFNKKTKEGKRAYKIRCIISDIVNFKRARPGMQTYQILCVGEHSYINELTMLNRPFEGTIGSLVDKIVRKDLKLNPKYIGKINTSTNKIIKGIYPQLRPINAIRWLMRNAFENNTPFFFYESITADSRNKVHFTSLTDLAKADVVAEFERQPYNTGPMEEDDDIRRKQILRVVVPEVRNMFESLSEGALGSVMTTLDIATKTIKADTEHKYDGKFVLEENKFKPIGQHIKFLDKKITEFPYARRFYSSQNSMAFNQPNYHAPVPDHLSKGIQKQECMEISKLTIDINGDPRVKLGSKISVKIGKAIDHRELEDLKKIDESISGVYIVYGIGHVLNASDSWISTLALRKDSSRLDYDSKVTRIKDKQERKPT